MAFDPSTISDIGASGPDITGSMAKGFQLKDMVDSQQLKELKLGQEKATLEDDQKAKTILSGSKLNTQEGLADAQEKLTKAGLPQKAMELRKYGQDIQSGELDNQLKKAQLGTQYMDSIVASIDPIVAKADEMRRSGKSDAMIQAYIQAQTPLVLQQFQEAKLPPEILNKIHQSLETGPVTYDKLKAFENGSKEGQALGKARIAELQAQTGVKREQETERHNQTMEELAAKREADKPKAPPEGSKSNALLAALADRGATLPQGMRSKSQQDAILNGLIARHPDMTVDQIADGVARGSLSMSTEKTESNVLGRREAAILPVEKSITKPGGFLDQAETAVNKVDFSKLKAAGAFESWTKEQNSDPALTAYKAAVAELRAEYSIVLSKGGQVTDAARHEAEKVIPDLITKEQFKSIKNTVRQGIEASKGGVEESISGVGKKPTDDHPPDVQALLDKYK